MGIIVDLRATDCDLERLKMRALMDYGQVDENTLSKVAEDALRWRLHTLEAKPPLTVKYEGSAESASIGSEASPDEIDTWGKIYNILEGGTQ